MGGPIQDTTFMAQKDAAAQAALAGSAQSMEASRYTADPLYAQKLAENAAQQGFVDNLAAGFKSTSAAKIAGYLQDEQAILKAYLEKQGYGSASTPLSWLSAATGMTMNADPSYIKVDHFAELTKDVPVDMWDNVMGYDTLQEAQAAKARILATTSREERLGLQRSSTSTLAMVAGGFLDVDLPLMFMTGGYYGAAKVGRAVYKAGRIMGLSGRMARGIVNVADGMAAGAQAGALVSAAQYSVDDTATADTVLHGVLTGATTGGALGMFVSNAGRKVAQELQDLAAHNALTRPMSEIDTELDTHAMDGALDLEQAPMAPGYETTDTPGPSAVKSVGAARVAHTGPALTSPYEPILDRHNIIMQKASDWLDRTGARQYLNDLDNTVFGKIMTGHWQRQNGVLGTALHGAQTALTRLVNATGNDVMGLFRSKGSIPNWIALNIFENPSSYGRGITGSTASTLSAAAERRIASTVLRMPHVAWEWAKKTNNTQRMMGKAGGFGISEEGSKALYREVYLNLNDLRMGRAARSANDPHVSEIVRMVQEHGYSSLKWMQGYGPSSSVKGTELLKPDPGYIPQRLNGHAVINAIDKGLTTLDNIINAMSVGYQAAGLTQDVADIVAKANVGRNWRRAMDVDTSLIDLLTEDGRGFLHERLVNNGIADAEAQAIVEKIAGIHAMAGQPGFTKHRNDLDMDIAIQTTDGSDLRLVDIMDHDIPNMLQRYRKGVAGSGALAKKGIRSRKDLDEIISASAVQQRALGESVIETDKLKAMFSDFAAGPSHGYAMGVTNKGVDAPISVGKAVANLALLGNLGFSQMIDSANHMAADGVGTWWRHTRALRGYDAALKQADSSLRDDLAVLMGEIGQDHNLFRDHLQLDEIKEGDAGALLNGMRRLTGNLSYIQGYTSMFNMVRGHQQTVGAAILGNKVLKSIRDGVNLERITHDFGIPTEMQDQLKDLMDTGVIEFTQLGNHSYVNRLNPNQWDATLADNFGAAMVRGQDMAVMRNLPGETDVWMRSNWGALVTHLKMFPLTAIPKQMMRNGRFMDAQTMGSLMYGIGLAYAIVKLRNAITGADRTEKENALTAVGYSNMMGWIPMAWDPAMTMLGLDDYRMQRYGRYYEATVPGVEVANRLLRVPGAAMNFFGGEKLNGDDKQALLTIPFMRTLGIGEWMVGTHNKNVEAAAQAVTPQPVAPEQPAPMQPSDPSVLSKLLGGPLGIAQ